MTGRGQDTPFLQCGRAPVRRHRACRTVLLHCATIMSGTDDMRLVKRAIKRALTSHAGWRASAWARPRGVLVLTYHRVCPADDTFPAWTSATSPGRWSG